jgi:hypothetical protein
VNRDRDRTLKEIIYLATTRYNMEQEMMMVDGEIQGHNSMLRRVSLNSVSRGTCLQGAM